MQKHPVDQLHDLKRELIERVKGLEPHLREIQATYPKRITELSKEADRLAVIFKTLVKEAPVAYMSGDKAGAKELSNQRKETQEQCEALNAQVNAMRKEMADTREAIITAKQEIVALNDKIKRYDHLRLIAVDGFEQAQGVNAAIVGEELSVLPARLLHHIKRVTYVNRKQPDLAEGRTARKGP